MPPLHFRLVIQNLNDTTPDVIEIEEPVRCPGCANTVFIRPTLIKVTYDVVCVRCHGVYSLTELVYNFNI